MKPNLQWFGKILMFFTLALVLTGCPPKKKDLPQADAPVPEEQMPETMQEAASVQIGSEWTPVSLLSTVYFETNKGDLSAESRATLKKNAAVLKAVLAQASAAQIRVEGYADQRGTVEYNLALGQRRANSLRDYYKTLGFKKSQMVTISFGEEKPLCSDENENCWWKNRRGETTLRVSGAPVTISLDNLPQ